MQRRIYEVKSSNSLLGTKSAWNSATAFIQSTVREQAETGERWERVSFSGERDEFKDYVRGSHLWRCGTKELSFTIKRTR